MRKTFKEMFTEHINNKYPGIVGTEYCDNLINISIELVQAWEKGDKELKEKIQLFHDEDRIGLDPDKVYLHMKLMMEKNIN